MNSITLLSNIVYL